MIASGLPPALFAVGTAGAALFLFGGTAPEPYRDRFGRWAGLAGAVLVGLAADLVLVQWAVAGGSNLFWSPDVVGYVGWIWVQLVGLVGLAMGVSEGLPSPSVGTLWGRRPALGPSATGPPSAP